MSDQITFAMPTLADFKDSPPFDGEVIVSQYTAGKFGNQWEIGIFPYPPAVSKGPTGLWTDYIPLKDTTSKKTILYRFLKALGDAGKSGLVHPRELIGFQASWQRQDLKFGKNKDTGEDIVKEGFIMPVAAYTGSIVAGTLYTARASSAPTATVAQAAAVTPETANDDEVTKVIDAVNGHQYNQAVSRLTQAGLSPATLSAVLGGDFLQQLVTSGKLAVDTAGVYHATL